MGPGRTPTVHTCSLRRGGRGWLTHETTIHNIFSLSYNFEIYLSFSIFYFHHYFMFFFLFFFIFDFHFRCGCLWVLRVWVGVGWVLVSVLLFILGRLSLHQTALPQDRSSSGRPCLRTAQKFALFFFFFPSPAPTFGFFFKKE